MMTEKEKSQLGLLYNANYDQELIEERLHAKGLCYDYNQLHPAKINEREALIKKLLGKTTDRFLIEQPFVCDYGYNIEIGENFYSNHNIVMLDGGKSVLEITFLLLPIADFIQQATLMMLSSAMKVWRSLDPSRWAIMCGLVAV